MIAKDGRASRGEYWATALISLILLTMGGMSVGALPSAYKPIGFAAYIVLFIVAFVVFRRLAARRAHDLGRATPSLLRPAMGLALLLKKGDAEPNDYGPPTTWQGVAISWAGAAFAWWLFIKIAPLLVPAQIR